MARNQIALGLWWGRIGQNHWSVAEVGKRVAPFYMQVPRKPKLESSNIPLFSIRTWEKILLHWKVNKNERRTPSDRWPSARLFSLTNFLEFRLLLSTVSFTCNANESFHFIFHLKMLIKLRHKFSCCVVVFVSMFMFCVSCYDWCLSDFSCCFHFD